MNDHAALDKELNEQILAGDVLAAFERFYADDVVMQENLDEQREGKEANRLYEQQFTQSIAEWRRRELVASAMSGDLSFSEWFWDFSFRNGPRVSMGQVAVRRWKDGKVAHERFYHKA